MVDRQRFLGSESFSGSGILVGTNDGEHLILTSRHVVDPSFAHMVKMLFQIWLGLRLFPSLLPHLQHQLMGHTEVQA